MNNNNNKISLFVIFFLSFIMPANTTENLCFELLLIDDQGRQVGYNPATGEIVKEIPKSSYGDEESVPELDGHSGPPYKELEAMTPAKGEYILYIIGKDTGPYQIDIRANDQNADEIVFTTSGTIYPGEIKKIFMNYSPVPGEITQIFEDNTPPAVITDLVATQGTKEGEITITWTAPGDDGTVGNIVNGKYNIKYSTYLVEVAPGEYSVASTEIIWSTNISPGNIETKVITGLIAGTRYYFQIRTADEVLNWSELSNVASVWAGDFYLSQILKGLSSGAMAYGDYDGDGDLDLVISGDAPDTGNRIAKLYRNNNGVYEEDTEGGKYLKGMKYGSFDWGDYDSDGDLDLVQTGTPYNNDIWAALPPGGVVRVTYTIVYRNDSGVFIPVQGAEEYGDVYEWISWRDKELTGVKNGGAVWGDFNNDGALDLAVVGKYEVLVDYNGFLYPREYVGRIYRNEGGVFVYAQDIEGVEWGSLAWGDCDNDGDLDLAVTGENVNRELIAKIYRNDRGVLTEDDTAHELIGALKGEVAWGDYNNDGWLDLVITGVDGVDVEDAYIGPTGIYTNENGRLVKGQELEGRAVLDSSVAWGDYDNDGDLDLLITGESFYGATPDISVCRVYNNVDGIFSHDSSITSIPGVAFSKALWGDIDADGDIDIAVMGKTGAGETITHIYKSWTAESGKVNSVPSSPTDLYAIEYEAGQLILGWDSGSDMETQGNGLYYNVRVGTQPAKNPGEPGFGNIVSGKHASPLLGNYLRPKISATQLGVRLNLPENVTYYWSVQTIDTGLTASAWSTEQSTCPNVSPADITDLQVVSITSYSVTLAWTSTGDDETVGDIVGGKYLIKYSPTLPIASYTIEWTTNTSPGKREGFTVNGLNSGTPYYFALFTRDEVVNWSGMSNVIAVQTLFIAESTDGVVSIVYQAASLLGDTTEAYINIESTTTSRGVLAISSAAEAGDWIIGNLYDIGPDGTVFSPSAVLTFRYSEPLPEGVVETDLNIHRYAPDTGWQIVPVLERNTIENWIKIEISSVSIYAILVPIPDILPPQTTVEIGEPKYWGARPYVRSDTRFNLSSMDDLIEVDDRVGLGVKYMEYWINSDGHIRQDNPAPSQGAVFSSSWTLTELSADISEGKQSIYYFAEDILGNIEETKEQKVIIDNTAPSVNYHPTKFLYQNNTTVYASLSTKIGISATDVDQNFIHYNFTSQSDDFEVVSGSWTTDTQKGHYIQQNRYATGYTKSVLKNWRWPVRLDSPEYALQVQVHISSYIGVNYNNTGNLAGGSLIYFRYQDKNNYYALYISERDKQIRVIRQATGLEQELISVDYPVGLNRWYDVGLTVSAGTIKANIFGTEILNISDTHLFDDETIGFGSDNAVVRFADLRTTRPALFGEISDASGFKEMGLKQNNQMEQVYQSQPQEVTFISEGLITLDVTAQDNLTNICIPARYTFGVDGTSPETTLNSSENYYPHLSLPEISYAPERAVYGFESKDRQGKDGIASGLDSTNYRIDSTDSTEPWVVFRATGTYPTFILQEGRRTLDYYSLDNVQNAETIHTRAIWVDGTPPQTTLTMTGGVQWTSSDGKLYSSIDTQYVLTAQDPLSGEVASGVQDTYYRIDDNPNWTLFTQPITLTEGIRTIHYWSNDNVLNAEQVKTFIVHIDNTAPVTSIEAGQPKCTEHGEPVSDAHQGTVIASNTPLTLSAVDTTVENVSSGVKQTNYKIGAGEFTTYTQLFKITGADGDYTVQYYSKDNVLNTEATKSITYTLDNTPPVAEIVLPSEENTGLCRIISGKTPIIGTVEDLHFKWYQLSYSAINADDWQEICPKTYREITEGVLAVWDTTSLAEGWYVIKLVTQDCVANETTDVVEVYVGRPELALEISGFNKPSYIVLDSTGNIYISDTNNDKVKKYNPQGDLIMTLSGIKSQGQDSPGKGTGINKTDPFNKPTGVALDTSGNLYVADGNNARVIKFSPGAEHLLTLTGFNKPHGLATDVQGNMYVADRNNNRIQKYSPDGTLLMTITTAGMQDDGLNKPQGVIAVDLQERIYITDRNNDRVLIYNSSGVFITQISSASGLNKPDGIVVNQQGYIYVSDTNNDVVRKYDRALNLVATYDGTTKKVMKKFNKPAGLTIDTRGDLYVVDSNNDKMLKYTLPDKPDENTTPGMSTALLQPSSDGEFKLGEVFAYPNPAKGGMKPTLHIEVGAADRVEIKIYNIAAELVHTAEIAGTNYKTINTKYCYEYTWNVSDIASGVYIYCVIAEKQGYSPIKVIKKVATIK